MLLTILGMFFNVPVLIFGLVLLATAAAIYFVPVFGGPTKLLSLALDWRTYVAVGGVAAIILFFQSANTIKAQQNTIAVQAISATAAKDSGAVVTDLDRKKTKRAAQAAQEQTVIDHAPQPTASDPSPKVDALMDEIAKERCTSTIGAPPADCTAANQSAPAQVTQ